MPALRSVALFVLVSFIGCGSAHADVHPALLGGILVAGGLVSARAVPPEHRAKPVIAADGETQAQRAARAPSTDVPASGYLVVISVQASEADALASFKVLQAKYATVLGHYQAIIKRVDLGEKGGVRYRAAVGPFATKREASALCGSLKLAGGQCFPFANQ